MDKDHQDSQKDQQINIDRTFWAAIILSLVAAASVVLSVFLIIRYPVWQVILMGIIAGVSLTFDIISIVLIRGGRYSLALRILYWTSLITLPPYAILFTNISLILIGTVLLVGFLEVFLLFPRAWRRFLQFGPLVSAAVILLAEFINPVFRFDLGFISTTGYFGPGVIIFLSLGIIFLVLRQAMIRNIRTKLITAFFLTTIVSVGIIAYFTQQSLNTSLMQNIGVNMVELANAHAAEIGSAVEQDLQLINALSLNTALVDAATSSSHEIPLSQDEIEKRDEKWRAADTTNNEIDPLITSVINNSVSSELKNFRDNYAQQAEIFLTNIQGVIIAATNRTSDYYQADEEWWQTAYQEGIYVGQPQYDESSNIIAITMAVAIRENGSGKIAGILRTTVNFTTLTDSLIAGYFGQTGRTIISLPDGLILKLRPRGDGTYELVQEYASPEIRELGQSEEKFRQITLNGVPVFTGHAKMIGSGHSDFQLAISRLDWNIISLQDQSEALQPLKTQTRNIIGITVVLLIAVIFSAFGLARAISGPVIRLNTIASKIASGDLTAEANVETHDEIGTLASTFNNMTAQLRELVGSLEQRVTERTVELETSLGKIQERTAQLEAIADVARSIASLKGMDQLLPEVTMTISQRFGFYHVGIFLLDTRKEFAVLRAANSEGGQKMLARNHKLRIGQQGIVGFVVAQKIARIALDVGEDAVFFDNPDLPATRSEMALPLAVGNDVIGALDVQSNQPNAFSEEDIQVLTTLADEVAIAIENARLFEQSQKTLQELELTFQRYVRNQWQQYSELSTLKGYRANAAGLEPITKPFHPEKGNKAKKVNIYKVPVSLRGVTIGTLDVDLGKKPDEYTQEENDIIKAAVERIALALEGARLLEESQRRAAKEQTIGEITAKIGASINVRNVLQTAVEELGRILPGSAVEILLKEKQAE